MKPGLEPLKEIVARYTMYVPEPCFLAGTYILEVASTSINITMIRELLAAKYGIAILKVERGILMVISEDKVELVTPRGFITSLPT